ncbi:MAG TPA: metalloregulator ArsR/SmtB family transcription factor [Acidimicrobiia bacterium]|nr:metalloregulator ArsR/SmtB family transcription factor [Acidimicrobiia bacterium]
MDYDTTPPACTEADLPPAPPLTEENVALIGRALAHPERIRILRQFTVCTPHIVQEIVDHSDLAQSTISEHLRILREAGVLFVREEGPRHWYCMRRTLLREFARVVDELADDSEFIEVSSRV